jgi:hypothetical protein
MLQTTLIPLIAFLLLLNCNITAQTPSTMPAASQKKIASLFDGERAFVDLVRQVQAGPRVPGSPGLSATRELITSTLAANGWSVGLQDFRVESPLLKQEVDGQNIFGVYPKGAPVKYVVSAHYDTRPFADMDPDPAKRQQPVPGANDGASGVAALLELARVIPQAKPGHGIALVFFDIEDHGAPGNNMGFCLGSQHFANNTPESVQGFQFGINLDMVADIDLKLPMEGYSLTRAPKLTFDLWSKGNALYPEVWVKQRGPSIYDDHMPFLALGKQYIDVIDFDYAPWHTTADTTDKCSPESLDIVGDTIFTFILH